MLVFMDGFDHWTTGQHDRKWDELNPDVGGNLVIQTDSPRSGSGCLQITTSNTYLRKSLSPSLTEIIVGFAIRKTSLRAADYASIFRVRAAGSSQVGLQYSQNDQRFRFLNGLGSDQSVVSTNTYDLSSGYVHLEMKMTFDNVVDANNTVELRVNGNVEISDTMDTDPENADLIDSFEIVQPSSLDSDYRWDDFYVLNTTAPNGDFLGDSKITTLYPDADGAVSDWTGSGSPDWQQVDESTPDDDTSYIESSVNTERSLFSLQQLTGVSTISAIQVNVATRKTTAGNADLKILTRSGAVPAINASGTLTVGMDPTIHNYVQQQQDIEPEDAVAWTVANLNNAQFGVEAVV